MYICYRIPAGISLIRKAIFKPGILRIENVFFGQNPGIRFTFADEKRSNLGFRHFHILK